MRLATAADEILPMRDQRVQQNPGYLSIILLARVVTKLGDLRAIDTRVIERLFTADLAYLQNLYRTINEAEIPKVHCICPKCEHEPPLHVQGLLAGSSLHLTKRSFVRDGHSLERNASGVKGGAGAADLSGANSGLADNPLAVSPPAVKNLSSSARIPGREMSALFGRLTAESRSMVKIN